MKKLSLIAGLACLATVGGVFGAWTFGTADVGEVSENVTSITVDSDIDVMGTIDAEIGEGALSLYVSQDKTEGQKGYKIEATGNTNVNFQGSYSDATTGLNADYVVTATLTVAGDLADYFKTGTTVDVTHDAPNKAFTIPFANVVTALNNPTAKIGNVTDKNSAQDIIDAVNDLNSAITLVVTITPEYTAAA